MPLERAVGRRVSESVMSWAQEVPDSGWWGGGKVFGWRPARVWMEFEDVGYCRGGGIS